jgi:hypothetical protein
VTTSLGRFVISASSGGSEAGAIASIAHYQTVFVYLDEAAWLAASPHFRHTIQDEIIFDDSVWLCAESRAGGGVGGGRPDVD